MALIFGGGYVLSIKNTGEANENKKGAGFLRSFCRFGTGMLSFLAQINKASAPYVPAAGVAGIAAPRVILPVF
ncbi:MAG: hypothetical protein LBG79_04370 [Spirochaetaceae bacterium]|jgi:hypothetical protein|nr:hypothetical protein [Spirochaetaceae bacterium]